MNDEQKRKEFILIKRITTYPLSGGINNVRWQVC